MATVREGQQPVLLVVDAQVGVLAGTWQAERVVERLALAVERARVRQVPVLWVQHEDDELPHDSDGWQLVPALQPAPGEPRLRKRFNSSFEQTPLEAELARLGASHIVLGGAASSWCIRATAHAALERGYDLTLLTDAHTTQPLELPGGERVEAAGIVAELNAVMTWLQYPGRRCTTDTATAVDFGAPGGGR